MVAEDSNPPFVQVIMEGGKCPQSHSSILRKQGHHWPTLVGYREGAAAWGKYPML